MTCRLFRPVSWWGSFTWMRFLQNCLWCIEKSVELPVCGEFSHHTGYEGAYILCEAMRCYSSKFVKYLYYTGWYQFDVLTVTEYSQVFNWWFDNWNTWNLKVWKSCYYFKWNMVKFLLSCNIGLLIDVVCFPRDYWAAAKVHSSAMCWC